jgi:hypothetical protein
MVNKAQFGPFILRKRAHYELRSYINNFFESLRRINPNHPRKVASTSQIQKNPKKFPEIEKKTRSSDLV